MTTNTPLAGRPGFRTARSGATVIAVIAFFAMVLTPQPFNSVGGVVFFLDIVLLAVLTWMHVFSLRRVIREQRARQASDERSRS